MSQARRALIAIIRLLGQQRQDQCRHAQRQPRRPFLQRQRGAGQVGMDQAEGIGLIKRRGAGRQRVKDCAQGIEISAVINRAIHTPGLLRRQVGRQARQMTGVAKLRVFLGKASASDTARKRSRSRRPRIADWLSGTPPKSATASSRRAGSKRTRRGQSATPSSRFKILCSWYKVLRETSAWQSSMPRLMISGPSAASCTRSVRWFRPR